MSDMVTVELTREEAALVALLFNINDSAAWGPFWKHQYPEYSLDALVKACQNASYFTVANQLGVKNIGEVATLAMGINSDSTPTHIGCRNISYSKDGVDLGDDYKLSVEQLEAMAAKCKEGE